MATNDLNNINRDSLNNEYIEVSNQIMILNQKRIDILNKLKQWNFEYRKSLGEGLITETVDIDDNSEEEEDKIIVEPKAGVRGRKKKTETEKPAKTEKKLEEPEPAKVEEPVGEPKKSKGKKTTKKEEVKEEVVVEEEEEVVEKVKGKKGKKK